ncbi:MAG: ABC transporter permease [Solobacterium sp.]|nr:ABC transporter permease [Solobacterium sp.]MBR3202246.1 ABC transporter permease [Solobacterium sp.]
MSLNFGNLFGAMPGGIAQGIIWGFLALGVYITFRLLGTSDLTVDGSFTTGGAVTVMLILGGVPPILALVIAAVAGIVAGTVTGLLHTVFDIPAILAGILTQFALYSINLAIMGMAANKAIPVNKYALYVSSRNIPMAIVAALVLAAILIALLYWYFGTQHGSAMRATGCNPEMAKAQSININSMKVIGFAMANGFVALSGGLLSQYQGFADINMGRGAIVIGLAAVIIGEVLGNALLGKHLNFAGRLSFVIVGGIIYYLVIVIVLWLKLDSNYLKLLTAVVVAVFLAVPNIQAKRRTSFRLAGKRSVKSAKEAA